MIFKLNGIEEAGARAYAAAKAIETAQEHMGHANYGLATDWLKEALSLLPVDAGQYIIWEGEPSLWQSPMERSER
jgi:hypothetical protein